MVENREEVESSYSTIATYLQRRYDLIPNLVNTVKGYSDYEQSTLTAVTEARTALQNAGTTNEKVEASQRLDSALNVWVNAVTEAYPDLKANEQYKALTDELSGSENRIATARKDYNEEAQEYNSEIKKFPRSILASLFGFETYEYFEADGAANSAPIVDFD
ncbi:MAG: LemA family protein [Clostridia bacterium]|nr:LemA family protein [Clostridia bacterium]